MVLKQYQGIDFEDVFDDLTARGWMTQDAGTLSLTQAGQAGLLRARERSAETHKQTHDGISTAEYVAALNVLWRMVANLGGSGDLPSQPVPHATRSLIAPTRMPPEIPCEISGIRIPVISAKFGRSSR